ncbi:MAG TPA: DUF819 family protein [Bacteroidetes bacterium]|nr:DUF819 family protein [Bacteroidota bacterium]
MLTTLVLVLVFLGIPALLLYLCHRFPILDKLGAVVLAYVLGLIIGNTGILPEGSIKVLDPMSQFSIPIAFPLLLFSLEIRNFFTVAGKTLFSMIIALFSIVAMIVLGYYLVGNHVPENWKVSGMLIGVYTGGTPNLASIRTALQVTNETYLLTHTYDIVLGAIYFIFLLTIAQRVLHVFLPPHVNQRLKPRIGQVVKDAEGIDKYGGMFSKEYFIPLLGAFGLALLIFAVGGGLSLLVPESAQMVVVILVITTGGIIFSLVPRIHNIQKTFQLGMYFVVVFCFAVSAMANLSEMINIEFLYLFLYVALAYFGTLILHVALSAIFRIDADTTLITSTALLYSPPFVPVVANALNNKDVIVPGITVGVVGYAVGNYLGVAIGYILQGI